MTDDKMQPNLNDRTEKAKAEQVGHQSQLSQVNAETLPVQRAAPGRMPLFRH